MPSALRSYRSLPVIAIAVAALMIAGRGASDARVADESIVPQGVAIMGDVNCGGVVDSIDSLQVLRGTAGLSTNADCMDPAGDVDCDADADSTDALRILRFVASLPVQAPDDCTPIGNAIESRPTSFELIDEALAASDIDEQEALMYRIFADFGDERLPDEYRGSAGDVEESAILHQAMTVLETLREDVREAIEPYLLPPSAPGSWVELREAAAVGSAAIQWETTSGEHVKVWWHSERTEDAAKATAIRTELENKIWPTLVDYMGEDHAPFSDIAEANNGSDGLFDVYLVHNAPSKPGEDPVLGYVSTYRNCENAPAFMALNSRREINPELFSTVAHEFMHAIQFTYDVGACADYNWMFEATATWAENFVYPTVNAEHGFAQKFFDGEEVPLETWVYKDPRQYGAYIFFYFLEKRYGDVNVVRDIWNASGNTDSLKAIESVIGGNGGFENVWPEFAVYNWNREPYEQYTTWDHLFPSAPYNHEFVDLPNAQPKSFSLKTDLKHVTQKHYSFEFNDSVRSVTVKNPYANTEVPGARVQALEMFADSGWLPEVEDWTALDEVHFCRDKPEEDIEELVLIVSNSKHDDRSHVLNAGDIEVTASPVGCEGWNGTAQAEVYYFDATYRVTVDNIRFAPDPDNKKGGRYQGYELAQSGPIHWHAEGTWPNGCPVSGTMTVLEPLGYFIVDTEDIDYEVGLSGHNFDDMLSIDCKKGSFELPWPVISVIWDGGGEGTDFKDEGGVLVADAEYVDPTATYGGTWTWRFTETRRQD